MSVAIFTLLVKKILMYPFKKFINFFLPFRIRTPLIHIIIEKKAERKGGERRIK